jgi:hypothetical protein
MMKKLFRLERVMGKIALVCLCVFLSMVNADSWCGTGCETCSSNGFCISCGPGYAITNSGTNKGCVASTAVIANCARLNSMDIKQCVECDSGYGLANSYSHATTCKLCTVSGCKNCDANAGICLRCSGNKKRLNGSCGSGSCSSSLTKCDDCDDNSTSKCANCYASYGLNRSGTCSACPSGCLECLPYYNTGATVTSKCRRCNVAGKFWMAHTGECLVNGATDTSKTLDPLTFGKAGELTDI